MAGEIVEQFKGSTPHPDSPPQGGREQAVPPGAAAAHPADLPGPQPTDAPQPPAGPSPEEDTRGLAVDPSQEKDPDTAG